MVYTHHIELASMNTESINSIIEELIAQMHGCMDSEATNYNPDAIVDDESCYYCDLGDVNCDDSLNVLDIVIAANMVLVGEYDEVADVNEDGQLDLLDVVMLVNWVLNGEPTLCDGLTGVELWGEWYDIGTTTTLYLEGLELGSIPPEIGCLTNLTYLGLYSNQLTGLIPPEIGNLTNLTYLSLWDNQLSGEIPLSITELTNLTYLNLVYNQLTGEILSEIGSMTNLTLLGLAYNDLTGEIPSEVCALIESNNLTMSWILDGNNLINTCD